MLMVVPSGTVERGVARKYAIVQEIHAPQHRLRIGRMFVME